MYYNKVVICLCLTGSSHSQNTLLIQKYRANIDMLELRVDLLNQSEQTWQLISEWTDHTKAHHNLPIIFTVRLPQDGGKWITQENNQQNIKDNDHLLIRSELLKSAAKSKLFNWIDIEANIATLSNLTINTLQSYIDPHYTQLIISQHYISSHSPITQESNIATPEHIKNAWAIELISQASLYPTAMLKTALSCDTTTMLCDFFEQCNILKDTIPNRYIVAPIGVFGMPGRILTAYTGSRWTYASEGLSYLGHVNPDSLTNLYQYKHITKNTDLYAIIGNPVLHSQSPQLHNRKFTEHKVQSSSQSNISTISSNSNKVYIHLPVDDYTTLPRLASLINLRGMSVTIPHKQNILHLLHNADKLVSESQSCNTVIINSNKQWHGYNTDIPGFLFPLESYLTEQKQALSQMSITIIGAGGTALSIAFALIKKCARMLISNRTIEKAQSLAKQLNIHHGPTSLVVATTLTDYTQIIAHSDVIVQTSSVGMGDDSITPLPDYPFRGSEIIYDVVYTPPLTKLMKDAQQHGCHTISGKLMFEEQGRLQSELYLKNT